MYIPLQGTLQGAFRPLCFTTYAAGTRRNPRADEQEFVVLNLGICTKTSDESHLDKTAHCSAQERECLRRLLVIVFDRLHGIRKPLQRRRSLWIVAGSILGKKAANLHLRRRNCQRQ